MLTVDHNVLVDWTIFDTMLCKDPSQFAVPVKSSSHLTSILRAASTKSPRVFQLAKQGVLRAECGIGRGLCFLHLITGDVAGGGFVTSSLVAPSFFAKSYWHFGSDLTVPADCLLPFADAVKAIHTVVSDGKLPAELQLRRLASSTTWRVAPEAVFPIDSIYLFLDPDISQIIASQTEGAGDPPIDRFANALATSKAKGGSKSATLCVSEFADRHFSLMVLPLCKSLAQAFSGIEVVLINDIPQLISSTRFTAFENLFRQFHRGG